MHRFVVAQMRRFFFDPGLFVVLLQHSKLKDLLRASILCLNLEEVGRVWRALETLQAQGIVKGIWRSCLPLVPADLIRTALVVTI